MKAKVYILIAAVSIVLLIFLFEVVKKENTLSDGQLVLLELAPVDPRSLMQGDYMELRYAETREIRQLEMPPRGYCILELDENNVGSNITLADNNDNLTSNQIAIRYFYNDRFVSIGAESYFFQEGDGDKYSVAKYGGLKVGDDGKGVLFGLFDESRELIK